MKTLYRYLKKSKKPYVPSSLTPLEVACFSWFSYFNYPEETKTSSLPIKNIGKQKHAFYKDASYPYRAKKVFTFMSTSPLYREIEVSDYENIYSKEECIQYAACTLKLSEDVHFVSFRGTDPTVTGWKEDFCLSLAVPTKGQDLALKYLKRILAKYEGSFYLGAHSKGGTLALYAYQKLSKEEKERILGVYLFDSPGLYLKPTEEDMIGIEKVHKYVPEDSVIGLFFEKGDEGFTIVSSASKERGQHNVFKWAVEGEDFVKAKQRTKFSRRFAIAFNRWVSLLSKEEKIQFIEVSFDKILNHLGTENFFAIGANPIRWFKVLHNYLKLNKEERVAVKKTLKVLSVCYKEAKREIRK